MLNLDRKIAIYVLMTEVHTAEYYSFGIILRTYEIFNCFKKSKDLRLIMELTPT